MPRLDPVTSEQVRALLFLDELGNEAAGDGGEFQVLQAALRHNLLNEIPRCGIAIARQPLSRPS